MSAATPRVLIGTDLVSVDRLAAMLTDRPDMADEVFTERELSYCEGRRRRHEHLAARFAAKEATLKALGTGLARGVGWRDVEVVNATSGRPRLHLTGKAREAADHMGVRSMEVTLSHSGDLAIAFTVLVCFGDARDDSEVCNAV